MKYIKNFIIMTLLIGSLTIQSQQNELNNQDRIVLNIIESMQECIAFHIQAQEHLKVLNNLSSPNLASSIKNIQDQNGIWASAIARYHKFILDIQKKYNKKETINLPTLKRIESNEKAEKQLVMQMNQYKILFERLLNEYILHFGKLYEKKAGLLGAYQTSYYLTSPENQSLPITPNEYILLTQVLDNVPQEWKKTIILNLPIEQENTRSNIEKPLTLEQITKAIKQVPLPAGYSIKTMLTAAAATAAIAAAAYYGYNYSQIIPENDLERQIENIEKNVENITEKNNNTEQPINKQSSDSDNDHLKSINYYWKGGSDTADYGMPGFTDEEVESTMHLLTTGQVVNNAGKYALTKFAPKPIPNISTPSNITTPNTSTEVQNITNQYFQKLATANKNIIPPVNTEITTNATMNGLTANSSKNALTVFVPKQNSIVPIQNITTLENNVAIANKNILPTPSISMQNITNLEKNVATANKKVEQLRKTVSKEKINPIYEQAQQQGIPTTTYSRAQLSLLQAEKKAAEAQKILQQAYQQS